MCFSWLLSECLRLDSLSSTKQLQGNYKSRLQFCHIWVLLNWALKTLVLLKCLRNSWRENWPNLRRSHRQIIGYLSRFFAVVLSSVLCSSGGCCICRWLHNINADKKRKFLDYFCYLLFKYWNRWMFNPLMMQAFQCCQCSADSPHCSFISHLGTDWKPMQSGT